MKLPRLPLLAVAFGAGILFSGATGPLAVAPLSWAAATLALAAGWWPRSARALTVWVLAAVALAGGVRASHDRARQARPAALPPTAIADDRALDELEGLVSGPIEDTDGGRRFVLATLPAGARVQVTVRGEVPPVLPGDRVAVIGRLRTPRGYRVPGAADMKRVVAARGARFSMTVGADAIEIVEPGARRSVWRPAAAAQRALSARIAGRGGDRDGNRVVRAMVAGDRGGLDHELSARFREAGVAHVLAVSGLHLAVVALLAFAATRRLWASAPALAQRVTPALAAALVAAPVAVAYTLVTGARISTMRALMVVLIVLAGAATGRRARVIDALGAAALLLLSARPATLLDPSFQLSFGATAVLALAMTGRRRGGDRDLSRARRIAGRATGAVHGLWWASVWATAGTAPLTALSFGTVATGGLVANLAVVPATEILIVPVALAGAALSLLWPAAGGLLIDLSVWVAGRVAALAGVVAAHAPVVRVPPPSPLELGAAAAALGAAIAGARRVWPARTAAAMALACAAVVAASQVYTATWARQGRAELRVTFLDVGQADAAVVELPGGAVWMFDAGGLPFVAGDMDDAARRRMAESPGEQSIVRFLAHRRIRRVDLVVLSHPHPDHYLGLAAVARAVDIGEVWIARQHVEQPLDPAFHALMIQLALGGTRIVTPPLGEVKSEAGATLTVLWPHYLDDETAAVDPVSSVNDNSLVVRLDFAGRRVLFAGDVETEAEQMLVERYQGGELSADIVKVPHHGSRTSSTAPFVAATAPRWVVISCGVANRFSFPAPEVVARWHVAGAQVWRTDQVGAVTVDIDRAGRIRVRGHDGR